MFRISAFTSMMQQIIDSRLNNGKRTLYPAYCDGPINHIDIEEYKDKDIPTIELTSTNGGSYYYLSDSVPKKEVYHIEGDIDFNGIFAF